MGLLSRWPLHPLLLAAYAVLFVYAANVGEVLPEQARRPAALVALGASARRPARLRAAATATCAGAPCWRQRHRRRRRLLRASRHPAVTVLDSAPDGSSSSPGPPSSCVVALYAVRARGSLPTVTAALNVFAFVLVVLTLVTIVPASHSGSCAHPRASRSSGSTPRRAPTRTPDRDIYFLIFDRYGSEWSLEHSFGVRQRPHRRSSRSAASRSCPVPAPTTTPATSASPPCSTWTIVDRPRGRAADPRRTARPSASAWHATRWAVSCAPTAIATSTWARGGSPRATAPSPTRSSPWARRPSSSRCCTRPPSCPRSSSFLDLDRGDTHSRDQHRDRPSSPSARSSSWPTRPAASSSSPTSSCRTRPTCSPRAVAWSTRPRPRPNREAELFQAQLDYTDERIRELVDTLLAGPDESDPIIVITGDEGPYLCYEVDCVDGTAARVRHPPGRAARLLPAWPRLRRSRRTTAA